MLDKKPGVTPNSNMNFTYADYDISPMEALGLWSITNAGYTFPVTGLSFDKKSSLFKFLDELRKMEETETFDYSTKQKILIKVRSENFSITCYSRGIGYMADLFCKDEKVGHKIYTIYFSKYAKKRDKQDIFVLDVYSKNGEDLNITDKNLSENILCNADKKYCPYIDTDLMFKEFFTNKENLLIFSGESGIGKSKMSVLAIKFFVENALKLKLENCKEHDTISIAHVVNSSLLANDEIWIEFEERNTKLVVVDDLDYMLTSRETEITTGEDIIKNNFIKRLLTFTDGIEKNNMKFIVTTNQQIKEMDDALLRQGRLFDIITLRKLTVDEARTIWTDEGLNPKEFKFTGDTTVAKLVSEIERIQNRSSVSRAYVKDPSSDISYILSNKEKKNRIGFS